MKTILALLSIVLLSSCKEELYTTEQCMSFKKGDTIYIKQYSFMVEKMVVIKNIPSLEMIEVKDSDVEWRTSILEYDNIRFK